MFSLTAIFFAIFLYLSLLFLIAYATEHGKLPSGLAGHPLVYVLSLGVYATTWTYYGSVGFAASQGYTFLTIYLGPILMFTAGLAVLRKLLHICKTHHITSIADFISARYGRSGTLAGLVTVIAVVGIMPYISLQLKAVSTSFDILRHYPQLTSPEAGTITAVHGDTAFYVTLVLGIFAILFGTRRIDAAEQHRGMVAAIAFESLVKLLAFLAVGLFVTFDHPHQRLLARPAEALTEWLDNKEEAALKATVERGFGYMLLKRELGHGAFSGYIKDTGRSPRAVRREMQIARMLYDLSDAKRPRAAVLPARKQEALAAAPVPLIEEMFEDGSFDGIDDMSREEIREIIHLRKDLESERTRHQTTKIKLHEAQMAGAQADPWPPAVRSFRAQCTGHANDIEVLLDELARMLDTLEKDAAFARLDEGGYAAAAGVLFHHLVYIASRAAKLTNRIQALTPDHVREHTAIMMTAEEISAANSRREAFMQQCAFNRRVTEPQTGPKKRGRPAGARNKKKAAR